MTMTSAPIGSRTVTQRTELARWIESKIGRSDDREFTSNRAFAEHVGLSEYTIRKLRKQGTGRYKNYMPDPTTLIKLAEGIPETSLAEIQRMAGMPVEPLAGSGDERTRQFANAASRLTPENQAALMGMIKVLLEQQKRSGE